MKIQIKNRFNNEIIFEHDQDNNTFKLTIEAAVKAKISLREADMRRADMRWADMSGADMRWADMRWADMRWADMRWADMSWADMREANMSGANMSGADMRWVNMREADMRWAEMREADMRWADMRGANMREANMSPKEGCAPIFSFKSDAELELNVARKVLTPGALDMQAWHSCETTHCLAGWAIHLSGAAGAALEAVTSPSVAGTMLLPSASHLFYENSEAGTKKVIAWAEKVVGEAEANK